MKSVRTERRDGRSNVVGKTGNDARGAAAAALADEEAGLALEGCSDNGGDSAEREGGEDDEALEGEHLCWCERSVKGWKRV